MQILSGVGAGASPLVVNYLVVAGGAGGSGDGNTLGGAGGGAGGLRSTVTATGGGGGGGTEIGGTANGGNGGSGVVILSYPDDYTISNPGGGLTLSTSTSGTKKITSITAGTGNVSWSA